AVITGALSRLHKPGGSLGLAVSGGGDSVAMLYIASGWAKSRGIKLSVATVDHGLRGTSAAEAAGVEKLATSLGWPCERLLWGDYDGQGNLQDEARRARRRLLSEWAGRKGIRAIALGHTLDDQAETVLMRLGRGAGVDGLSAMAEVTHADGVRWLRPMLSVRREALREWLRGQGAEWVDDPSNDDPRYDRVKARKALSTLDGLGITVEGLAKTAGRMSEARGALDQATADLAAKAAVWGSCGQLRLALAPLREAVPELRRRLMRAGLTRAAGAEYGPRADAEARLLSAMLGLKLGGGRSLHGCLIRPDGASHVVITREAAALAGTAPHTPVSGLIWDRRFRIQVQAPVIGAQLSALGEAGSRRLNELAAAGDWRAPDQWKSAPRSARLATPALWRENALAAAPIAGYGDALSAELAPNMSDWSDGVAGRDSFAGTSA
ncbi:MAG: tRNA lysidine(34) synthetase TilS, partial [Pikeienuella sp.]